MADYPKLDSVASYEVCGLDDKKDSQKPSVSDHPNGLQYTTKKDSFVIDMDSFSNNLNKEFNANSIITRNFSRKGSLRGGEKKLSLNTAGSERDSSSPRGSPMGSTTAVEKLTVMTTTTGSLDHSRGPQGHHQITVTAGNIGGIGDGNTPREGFGLRRSSFRRSPSSWFSDPRRILLLFAMVSSMGSLLLIYFTLTMRDSGNSELQ